MGILSLPSFFPLFFSSGRSSFTSFVLLNARKERLRQVWEFFWHLREMCGCRVIFFLIYLFVSLGERNRKNGHGIYFFN